MGNVEDLIQLLASCQTLCVEWLNHMGAVSMVNAHLGIIHIRNFQVLLYQNSYLFEIQKNLPIESIS
jgi:hypothetical protein